MTHSLSKYESTLLTGWEDVFKKGQLTLWILLALKQSPQHMADIKSFINNATGGVLTADNQSMYRSLRRFHDSELVDFTTEPGDSGPDRKIYHLTNIGKNVLQQFIDRNIITPYYNPKNRTLLQKHC